MTNYALIGKLEEKLNEIQAIVSELRGSRKIITFEGKHYQKVDREAREDDVVIFRSDNIPDICLLKKDKPYKVMIFNGIVCAEHDKWNHYEVYTENEGSFRTPETVDVYELITSPVFATAVGQDLEAEYAEQVKQEVQHQTFQCSAARPPIEEVGQAFFEAANKVLNPPPNQLRAEIIEKAKEFVAEKSQGHHANVPSIRDGLMVVSFGNTDELELIVVEEKRKVIALIRTMDEKEVCHRGIAICAEGDVYNEHISKAIALGRALGLDVSEFEQAVQPSEYVKGQVITHDSILGGFATFEITEVNGTELYDGSSYIHSNRDEKYGVGKPVIINDTNAQYGDRG